MVKKEILKFKERQKEIYAMLNNTVSKVYNVNGYVIDFLIDHTSTHEGIQVIFQEVGKNERSKYFVSYGEIFRVKIGIYD